MTLKELMEHEWKEGPCRHPLQKCRWRLSALGDYLIWWWRGHPGYTYIPSKK